MDFQALFQSLFIVFSLSNLFFCALGVFSGIIIGALPGLTSTMGVALFIPLTFTLPPATGLILLGSIYVGSVYGGSISAIIIKTPGTPAAIITAIDGYELTQKGQGGRALGISTISSFFGGLISCFALLLIAPPLSKIVLKFGPSEIFLLAILGLTVIIGLSKGKMLEGLIAGTVGLMLATVGTDEITGVYRYTFDNPALFEGVPLVPMVIGLYSAGQVFALAEMARGTISVDAGKTSDRILPTWDDLKRLKTIIFTGGIIGTIVGIIPGAGVSIGSSISYNTAKSSSKHPEEFGNGSIDGVAASESANNGVVGGSLVPLLTLGIPGNTVSAIFLGGLIIHGLRPGSELFTKHATTTYSLLIGLFVAHIFMLILGLAGARYFAKVATFPTAALAPVILSLSVIGSYALRNNFFDVWIMLAFGILGYGLKHLKIPSAPLALGMILGPIAEQEFRRAKILYRGSLVKMFFRPLSLTILVFIILSLVWPYIQEYRMKRKAGA